MKNFHFPVMTISLAGLCLFITNAVGYSPTELMYLKKGVAEGQIWRLITAHLSHVDGTHLAWNIAGLLVLGSFLEMRIGKAILWVLTLGVLSVNTYLLLDQNLVAYCGLSGVLNTLLFALLLSLYRAPEMRWLVVTTGLLALAKILGEIYMGDALFIHTEWASLPIAHLSGLVGGVTCLSLPVFKHYKTKGANYE